MKLLTLLALGSVTLTGVLAIPQGCPAVTVTVVTTVYATSKPSTTTTATRTWMNTIPEIDVCGPAHGVSCPGAGVDGYYYRCCVSPVKSDPLFRFLLFNLILIPRGQCHSPQQATAAPKTLNRTAGNIVEQDVTLLLAGVTPQDVLHRTHLLLLLSPRIPPVDRL